MELQPYVAQVQAHLTAAAALGDDRTRQTADGAGRRGRAGHAAGGARAPCRPPPTRSPPPCSTPPGSPAVSVRLDGDDLRVEVRSAEPAPEPPAAAPDDADASARISLRLAEALKTDIERRRAYRLVSVNTWLVRAAARALVHRRPVAAAPGRPRPAETPRRATPTTSPAGSTADPPLRTSKEHLPWHDATRPSRSPARST